MFLIVQLKNGTKSCYRQVFQADKRTFAIKSGTGTKVFNAPTGNAKNSSSAEREGE